MKKSDLSYVVRAERPAIDIVPTDRLLFIRPFLQLWLVTELTNCWQGRQATKHLGRAACKIQSHTSGEIRRYTDHCQVQDSSIWAECTPVFLQSPPPGSDWVLMGTWNADMLCLSLFSGADMEAMELWFHASRNIQCSSFLKNMVKCLF